MASLGDALVKKITEQTAAEKKFRYDSLELFCAWSHPIIRFHRPFWDELEEYLLYGLVMLGLVTLPTSFMLGRTLDCTFCQDHFCDGLTFEDYQGQGTEVLQIYCNLNETKVYHLVLRKKCWRIMWCTRFLPSAKP